MTLTDTVFINIVERKLPLFYRIQDLLENSLGSWQLSIRLDIFSKGLSFIDSVQK